MKYEDARYKLEREVHDAFMAGESVICVVHGIGEGILKKLTMDFIKENNFLKLLNADESLFHQNPGVTKIEIQGLDKQDLKRYK